MQNYNKKTKQYEEDQQINLLLNYIEKAYKIM